MSFFQHSTAEVSPKAKIGKGTKIWHHSQVREEVEIGSDCILGKNVYVDIKVKIGKNCKIQNNVSVFHGVTLEDGVFVGPHVCFTNDKYPRAINEDGSLKAGNEWKISETLVKKGASIGANATILPGIVIGKYAVIGAGSVVTESVPDFSLIYGNPAKKHGKVNKLGEKIG